LEGCHHLQLAAITRAAISANRLTSRHTKQLGSHASPGVAAQYLHHVNLLTVSQPSAESALQFRKLLVQLPTAQLPDGQAALSTLSGKLLVQLTKLLHSVPQVTGSSVDFITNTANVQQPAQHQHWWHHHSQQQMILCSSGICAPAAHPPLLQSALVPQTQQDKRLAHYSGCKALQSLTKCITRQTKHSHH
jgi:hypothetical protein